MDEINPAKTPAGQRCYKLLVDLLVESEKQSAADSIKPDVEELINEHISVSAFIAKVRQFAPNFISEHSMKMIIQDGITELRQSLRESQMGPDDTNAPQKADEASQVRIKQEMNEDDHQSTPFHCPCGKRFTQSISLAKHQSSCKRRSAMMDPAPMYDNGREIASRSDGSYFLQAHVNQFNGVGASPGNSDNTAMMLNSLQNTMDTVRQRMDSMDASFIMKLNAVEERLNRKLDDLHTLVGRIAARSM